MLLAPKVIILLGFDEIIKFVRKRLMSWSPGKVPFLILVIFILKTLPENLDANATTDRGLLVFFSVVSLFIKLYSSQGGNAYQM